jgi:hypothetical protein
MKAAARRRGGSWLRAAWGAAAAAGLLLSLFGSRDAAAYPQFQFSSGTSRCNQCHYSPSGGTLITNWGRDESGEEISLGGDGAFLHGLWAPPAWLALGADLRLAGIHNDVGGTGSPETAFFPMQGDVYTRVATGAFSLSVTVGARGVVRPPDPSLAGRSSDLLDRMITPEHYLMWRPSADGPYLRVGRFAAPYGLRLVEHIFYVRRYTGYNLYEETYNLSGGFVNDDWELHATAFTHVPRKAIDFLGATGPPENGGAAYAERRLGNRAALALQARVGIAPEESRYQGGAVGKLWIERAKLLLLGEADFIRQQLSAASAGQNQFVSYLGATYVIRGLMAGVAYERFQENLAVAGTARDAYDVQINLLPWAHFEVVILGRYQKPHDGGRAGAPDSQSASLGMLQLHYYL